MPIENANSNNHLTVEQPRHNNHDICNAREGILSYDQEHGKALGKATQINSKALNAGGLLAVYSVP